MAIIIETKKLSKWGNSVSIRIPSNFLRYLGWKDGDEVEIKVDSVSDLLTISKTRAAGDSDEGECQ